MGYHSSVCRVVSVPGFSLFSRRALMLVSFLVILASGSLQAGAEEGGREEEDGAWADPAVALVDMREFLDAGSTWRKTVPERGQIVIRGSELESFDMAHWEERTGLLQAPRRGRYEVWLCYGLSRASLGVQCQVAGIKMKGLLRGSGGEQEQRRDKFGVIELSGPGEIPLRILTPLTELPASLVVHDLRLVPARGVAGGLAAMEDDGSLTLAAGDATTWSTALFYQADGEEGALCNWTEAGDFAEWEFSTKAGGSFLLTATYQCEAGNAGSVMEVRSADTVHEFVVQATGGPDSWAEVEVGEFEIPATGNYRLELRPRTKQGAEVMVLKRLVFRPRG